MKKVLIIIVTLFLAVNITAQKKEKKGIQGAIEALNLSKEEGIEVTKIWTERKNQIKEIRAEGKSELETKNAIIKVRKNASKKILEVIGKEKAAEWREYWKKQKK
ncbi:hypothetical protein [uncultured Polaribacter sp.]|uniref:hypothetical protein n=1 Tax=uncultured Polaribacter sp. TaxID=174711 RepID=UPI00262AE359|nr:hypothetical protein [uncultured Polaribacter sp.]